MAATIEVCLGSDKSLNLNANMYYWSDSQILLCRLKKEAKSCIEQRVKSLHCLGNTAQQLAIKHPSSYSSFTKLLDITAVLYA